MNTCNQNKFYNKKFFVCVFSYPKKTQADHLRIIIIIMNILSLCGYSAEAHALCGYSAEAHALCGYSAEAHALLKISQLIC